MAITGGKIAIEAIMYKHARTVLEIDILLWQ